MSCCCRTKGSKERKRRQKHDAPKSQSMEDRGDNMDEDERAVDWWRNFQQQHVKDSNDDSSATEQHRNREDLGGSDRNHDNLEHPYEINNRELPLSPRDGDTIQPKPRAAVYNSKISTQSTSNSLKVFEPDFLRPRNSFDRLQPSGKYDVVELESEPRILALRPTLSYDSTKSVDPPASQREPSPDLVGTPELVPVLSPKLPENGFSSTSENGPTEHFANSKKPQDPDEDADHLSDVPSDVDSVVRDRYLLACQMLKDTLIAKEKSIYPLEREFILSLLGDVESLETGSVISEEQVSAVERATLRLEKDPLFQDIDLKESTVVPPSPITAASLQLQEASQGRKDKKLQDIPKHPHTATRAHPKKSLLLNPCSPRSALEAGAADATLIVKDLEKQDEDYSPIEDKSDLDEGHLVRFDGWNFHDESAEYPFVILGADDPKLKTRVLTPSIMEALRGFFPYTISESNFWLKFSLERDGASLVTLLDSIRASSYTVIGVETSHGEVFGSFTGTRWRTGTKWFGTGEAFLWRMKKSRLTSPKNSKKSNFENKMEVYPYTGYDDLVQYCTPKTMAVGGGDWLDIPCPFRDEPRGIGFMIDGDLAGGESNSCATFANPRLCKIATTSNEFSIVNLEVWTLTPCLNVPEATKVEMHKLFVQDHYR